MPNKKPSPAPLTAGKTSTRPADSKTAFPSALNARRQADQRWQRTKRYGWDSR